MLQMGVGENSWTAFAAGIKDKLSERPRQAVSTEIYGSTSAQARLAPCGDVIRHACTRCTFVRRPVVGAQQLQQRTKQVATKMHESVRLSPCIAHAARGRVSACVICSLSDTGWLWGKRTSQQVCEARAAERAAVQRTNHRWLLNFRRNQCNRKTSSFNAGCATHTPAPTPVCVEHARRSNKMVPAFQQPTARIS